MFRPAAVDRFVHERLPTRATVSRSAAECVPQRAFFGLPDEDERSKWS
jgi:hypothetical protein